MDGFLRVDHSANMPGSVSNSFLADEVASICPLITPSPPTNDLINPLPEPTEPNYAIGDVLAEKLHHVQEEEKGGRDSASSSSSALAEPACAQLLNHRNVYHHITKDEESAAQETIGKTQTLQLTFRNPPEDYFFMSWNWPLIRKISMGMFLSGLVAMLALVITMITTLPKTCNPYVEWYQGSLFYEIFPARFHSHNKDSDGDLKGISLKSHYIKQLGVRAVRLNSIFNTPNYPNDFENVTNLIDIAPSLGDLEDFRGLVTDFRSRNISVILDLPLHPYVKALGSKSVVSNVKNETNIEPVKEFLISNDIDVIEESIRHWSLNGVNGFYLKGLEHFVDDVNFVSSLRRWRKILGPDRILIVSEKVLSSTPKTIFNILLNNIDLVDVKLKIEKDVEVRKQIDSVLNGTLFSKRGMPWVHWTLGNVYSDRLANILRFSNATFGATLLQMMLPGTPSIFYGDEIGLQKTPSENRWPQLVMMPWASNLIGNELPFGIFKEAHVISQMAGLRVTSPSIYMNAIHKEGDVKANAEVKNPQDLLVIQRWYPRRKPYVVVCNLGSKQMTEDLSALLYSGEVAIGPTINSKPGTISFKNVSLDSGESIVIALD